MRRIRLDKLPLDAFAIPDYPGYFATETGVIQKRADGRQVFVMVHRIIAQMFVPGDRSLTVNHKDMNKANCASNNLEWITHSENIKRGYEMKPEWARKVGDALSRPVVAIDLKTGERTEHASVTAAGKWATPSAGAAGNISNAIRTGRLSYGFCWMRA